MPPAKPASPLMQSPTTHFSLWITFEYIILFIALYVSTISFSGIAHHAIDTFVPDNTNKNIYSLKPFQEVALRGYIASVIVFYPVFSILFLHLKKFELANPLIKTIRMRKISIYFTLIVTFLITSGNFTSTLYRFLEGTTTSNSFAHLFTTLCIAGGVFLYYLWEVKDDRTFHA